MQVFASCYVCATSFGATMPGCLSGRGTTHLKTTIGEKELHDMSFCYLCLANLVCSVVALTSILQEVSYRPGNPLQIRYRFKADPFMTLQHFSERRVMSLSGRRSVSFGDEDTGSCV